MTNGLEPLTTIVFPPEAGPVELSHPVAATRIELVSSGL